MGPYRRRLGSLAEVGRGSPPNATLGRLSRIHKPRLSIIVCVYDMVREAPRTLHSLSTAHQLDVTADQYEVIVVDNGSPIRLDDEMIRGFGPNYRYIYIDDASASPAPAMNRGVQLASGDLVGLMIDGARIATPRLIASAIEAFDRHLGALVETIGFHLGPDVQNRSTLHGYNQQVEDDLLDAADWVSDGYRLFDVATLAMSSRSGWFAPISESNCVVLAADVFRRIGGYDERFDEPGGGFVNLDLYRRLVEDEDLATVRLLGEATFHQVHGGAATGLSPLRHRLRQRRWRRRYERIRRQPWERPSQLPVLFGVTGPNAQRWIDRSIELWPEAPGSESLGGG